MGLFSRKPKNIGYSIEQAINSEEGKLFWYVFSIFQKGKKTPEKFITSYEGENGMEKMEFLTKQEAIDKLYSFDKSPNIIFIENIDKVSSLSELDLNKDLVKSVKINGGNGYWFYNIRTYFGTYKNKMIFKGNYGCQINFNQTFADGTNKPGILPKQLLIILLDNQKRLFETSKDFENLTKFDSGIKQCLEALSEWDSTKNNNGYFTEEFGSDGKVIIDTETEKIAQDILEYSRMDAKNVFDTQNVFDAAKEIASTIDDVQVKRTKNQKNRDRKKRKKLEKLENNG